MIALNLVDIHHAQYIRHNFLLSVFVYVEAHQIRVMCRKIEQYDVSFYHILSNMLFLFTINFIV